MFEQLFKKTIKENIDIADDENEIDLNDPNSRDVEFKNSLDPTTDPSEFDINPISYRKITEENVLKAQKWADFFENFAELINGDADTRDESFHQFINRVDREGSPFRGIVRSETKKIIRVAQESASISETLKGYINGVEKKQRELLQQFPNISK